MRKLAIFFTMLFMLAATAQAAEFEEGKQYKRIDQQQTSSGDKVEVIEFFWYGCPHCYAFEPFLDKWKKDMPSNVEFVRVPATFRPLWTLHARMYYALQLLDKDEDLHSKLFNEIHKNKNYMKTFDAVTAVVTGLGVDRSEFVDAMNSFTVENQIRKARQQVKDYTIEGVPAIAVNGKYLVTASMAGNYENMIKITNYLIEKETAALAKHGKSAASTGS